MFTISRKLLFVSVVLLLTLNLGLSVKPAEASDNPCDPTYVVIRGNQFTVLPSGGDDTVNLQCALDAANGTAPPFFTIMRSSAGWRWSPETACRNLENLESRL